MTVLNFGIWSIKYHPCYDDLCVKRLHIKKWERDISLKPSTRTWSVRMSKKQAGPGLAQKRLVKLVKPLNIDHF